MLSEKLKVLRKQARMSQEQLAEKLGVSRQAVTKWETAAGVPDIDNLRALSSLFGVSIDELLDNESSARSKQDFLFDSVTEYDIDCEKSYDIALAGAKRVTLSGYDGEKMQVRLASDQISEIQSAFKVKIDDVKSKIDVDVRRFGSMTEKKAKEALCVFIRFPQRYVSGIELSGNTGTLAIRHLKAESLEFTGKAARVVLDGVSGHTELNSNEDMDIVCTGLDGRLDVNQIASTSKLSLPADTPFLALTRGMANSILYEKDGKAAAAFCRTDGECENVIELNGMKSELVINAVSGPVLEV